MEKFKRQAIESFPLKPRTWKCYVDDTDVVWPHGEDNLYCLFDHLNNRNENIKFAMEIEKNSCIPFLDALISRSDNGSITHHVYRKKTHTYRYLHTDSHHYPPQKIGVLNTLVTKALSICDKEHVEQELKHLTQVFKDNGYNNNQINIAINNAKKTQRKKIDKNNEDNWNRISLPYIKGALERIAKILRKKNIKVSFRPHLRDVEHLVVGYG